MKAVSVMASLIFSYASARAEIACNTLLDDHPEPTALLRVVRPAAWLTIREPNRLRPNRTIRIMIKHGFEPGSLREVDGFTDLQGNIVSDHSLTILGFTPNIVFFSSRISFSAGEENDDFNNVSVTENGSLTTYTEIRKQYANDSSLGIVNRLDTLKSVVTYNREEKTLEYSNQIQNSITEEYQILYSGRLSCTE